MYLSIELNILGQGIYCYLFLHVGLLLFLLLSTCIYNLCYSSLCFTDLPINHLSFKVCICLLIGSTLNSSLSDRTFHLRSPCLVYIVGALGKSYRNMQTK